MPPPGAFPLRPLHKPGIIPLRPLTLTDFFDGAFTVVRRNPRATIGMAALVTAGFMLVPILGSVAAGFLGALDGALDPTASAGASNAGTAAIYATSSVSSLFGLLAGVVVTGLIVPVVTRAAVGEKIDTGTAWQQSRGRLLRLLGLAVLELALMVVLITVLITVGALLGYAIGDVVGAIVLGILFAIAALCAALAIHMKWFQLAAPNLVIERRGVFASIRRAGRLSTGSFWRILGITLLVSLLSGVIGQIIGFPLGIVGGIAGILVPDPWGVVVLVVVSNLASIISGAVVAPFTGAVAVLQYLDQRFRHEGFDLDLITYVQRKQGS